MRSPAGFVLAALLGAAAAWLPSAPAKACSCLGRWGQVVWPHDQAVDVPLDTPIAIERQNLLGPPAAVAVVLEDDAGTRVALETVLTLPEIASECAFAETLFMRPVQPLRAGVRYTFAFELDPEVDAGVRPEEPENLGTVSFTTGSGMYEPPAAPPLSVRYLHVGTTTDPCVRPACNIAEVVLALDEPMPFPYWFALESRATVDRANRLLVLPGFRTRQASVVVPSDDRCVQFTLYAFDGTTLFDEERCVPDQCALRDLRSEDTCGLPLSAAVDALRLPEASCEAPYAVPQDMFGNPIYEDGGVADASLVDASIDEGAMQAPDAATSGGPVVPPRDAGTNANMPSDSASSGAGAASDDAAGCSVHGRSGSFGVIEGVLVGVALLRRRRVRRDHT